MRHLVVAISLFSQVTCLATHFLKRDIPACPSGFNNCGFFGCLEEACPTDCVKISSQEECTKTRVNTVGCTWYEDSCHRDIVCVQNVDLSCSAGCHPCDGAGCIPENEACPAKCTSLTKKEECGSVKLTNGVKCVWKHENCMFTPPANTNPRLAAAIAGLLNKAILRAQVKSKPGSIESIDNPSNEDLPSSAKNDGSGVDNSGPLGREPDASDPHGTPSVGHALSATTVTGSNGLWSAMVGGTVGVVALAGMAMLFATRAREKRQKEREHSGMVAPDKEVPASRVDTMHKRDSLLPFVRKALGIEQEASPKV